MSKIYVGNLPYQVQEQDLNGLFSQKGQVVSVKIIMDQHSGRSKGFGFVEMSSKEEAQAAIEAFNGHDLNGRALKVNEAVDKPREERGGGGGRGFGGGGGRGGDRGGGGDRW